jgi:integrase
MLPKADGRFLLTGGRESEVLGLEVDDISLDRGVVTFRPNAWRRLKTATSHRSVPLWPQLREILERYLAEHPPSRLLFPSYRTGAEAMLTDFRKLLDAVAVRAGWKPGEIRSKTFRHTYCAARLQTVDQGAPVSTYTVAREMGHGGEAMVRRVYGHLGQVRHRSEAVEYRIEQHLINLGPTRHRSSGVELSIRNRAVVGSNPTGGSYGFAVRFSYAGRAGAFAVPSPFTTS